MFRVQTFATSSIGASELRIQASGPLALTIGFVQIRRVL